MNPIAMILGSHVIYWNAVVIVLGVAACFCLTMALFTAHGGRAAAIWLLLPLAIALSLPLARFVNWYCHSEKYLSFWKAMTDYSRGDYCLAGAILGTGLAGLIVPILLVVTLVMFYSTGRRVKSIVEMIPFCLLSSCAFVVPYFLLGTFLGPEFASIISSYIGLVITVLAARAKIFVPKHIWYFYDIEKDEIIHSTEIFGSISRKKLLRAWLPYLVIAVTLLLTRVPAFGLRGLLNSASIHVHDILGVEGLNFDWALIYNPGLTPFLIVAVATLFLHRKDMQPGEMSQVFKATGRQLFAIALTLISGIAMVQIMLGSGANHAGLPGMIDQISTTLVSAIGNAFPLIVPPLGIFGAFVSGSCTVSGILFAPLEFRTAQILALPVASIVAR